MRVSPEGLKFLKRQEGEELEVYRDSVGLPTVGVGHLLTAAEKKKWKVGDRITQAESDALLIADLKRFEDCVTNSVTVPVNQNQFDALVSLAFNIGERGFTRSSVLRKLNLKDYEGAAEAFLMWNKAGGKVSEGLNKRRQREKALFLRPAKESASEQNPAKEFTSEQSPAVIPQETPAEPAVTPNEQTGSAQTQVSIFTKVTTGIGVITGLGINAGAVVQGKLEQMDAKTFLYLLVVLGIVAGCIWWYKTSSDKAHKERLNVAK